MRMVNARFPARALYGFEMVDAAADRVFSPQTGVNRKFTPNQIIRVFRKFLAI
jgi:hypothetical protein